MEERKTNYDTEVGKLDILWRIKHIIKSWNVVLIYNKTISKHFVDFFNSSCWHHTQSLDDSLAGHFHQKAELQHS